eukprot:5200416-Amphidinium_carterae.1
MHALSGSRSMRPDDFRSRSATCGFIVVASKNSRECVSVRQDTHSQPPSLTIRCTSSQVPA